MFLHRTGSGSGVVAERATLSRPFVYIASLRRTGSTVLAESLTSFPTSFIFREPELCYGRFNLRLGDASLFERHGVDLKAFRRRFAGRTISRAIRSRLTGRLPSLVAAFRSEVIEKLSGVVSQFGVKEIRHDGWESYLEHFPDTRIILTARDPRDIYISLYHRVRQEKGTWQGPFGPQAVADDLLGEFRRQMEMIQRSKCLEVKYEDLCCDPGVIERVRLFVDSPMSHVGKIGGFSASNPQRREEFDLHADRITDKRVRRWASETDAALLEAANKTFALMGEYCEFWGYAD